MLYAELLDTRTHYGLEGEIILKISKHMSIQILKVNACGQAKEEGLMYVHTRELQYVHVCITCTCTCMTEVGP